MATALAPQIAALHADLQQQRHLIRQQMAQIKEQQSVLDVQFRRIAEIQAELDLVKATVRLAAPTFAAALIGASPATSARVSAPQY